MENEIDDDEENHRNGRHSGVVGGGGGNGSLNNGQIHTIEDSEDDEPRLIEQ